jgi:hypothetical protein
VFFGKQPAGAIGKREEGPPAWHKRPSIFMPKEHSRFTLVVTDVKREPLQDISNADATAEGVTGNRPREAFETLWKSINGAASWDANPDVIATSFRLIRANVDTKQARAA